jgi:two-component system sensor histidine kinase DesK
MSCAPPDPAASAPVLLRHERRGQRGMLISLVFLVFPIMDLWSGGRPVWQLVVGTAAFAAFVALYVRVMLGNAGARYLEDVSEDRRGVALLAALAVVLAVVGGTDWSGMFCFVAATIGLRVAPPRTMPALLACAAAAAAAEARDNLTVDGVLSLFVVTIGVGMLTAGFRRLRHLNLELGQARDEIARLAVNDERLRFARDLHDLLGHSLSVIALKSELAGRLLPGRPADAAEHVRDIEAVSRRSLAEVREAVAGYRRPTLPGELAGARATLQAAGIEVQADPPPAALPPDAEAVLAWAVREGTTNVLRHAGAQRVRIALAVEGADARLELVDDGGGPEGERAPGTGTGLAGLAERVARVRGRLDAAPDPAGGFRLSVSVPLEAGA